MAAWQLPAHALVEPQGDLLAIPNLKDSGIGGGLSPTEYKHVTSYNNFYEFGTGKDDPKKNSGAFKSRPWTISIEGECDAPGEIGIEDIFKLIDQEERVYRFRCVEAWAMVVLGLDFHYPLYLSASSQTQKLNMSCLRPSLIKK